MEDPDLVSFPARHRRANTLTGQSVAEQQQNTGTFDECPIYHVPIGRLSPECRHHQIARGEAAIGVGMAWTEVDLALPAGEARRLPEQFEPMIVDENGVVGTSRPVILSRTAANSVKGESHLQVVTCT